MLVAFYVLPFFSRSLENGSKRAFSCVIVPDHLLALLLSWLNLMQ